jgi:hypothetical protein
MSCSQTLFYSCRQVSTVHYLIIFTDLKCADFHSPRNINELPNEIPRDVIARLKDFRSLCTQEDINSWRVLCETSPYEAIRSKY